MKNKKDFRIIFMGTPDFARETLKVLHENGFNIVAVITAPDKPAGRGRKIRESSVKKYALQNNLTVLQPTNLKNKDFTESLKSLKADLQVVVAFRMLPEIVWAMPTYGTANLHASLLPQYRGAAPINHAIINGETKTGVTTFFIEKEIDTGNIIAQKELDILPDDDAGTLHDKLMLVGGQLMLETVTDIMNKTVKTIPQKKLRGNEPLKTAPKIFKADCKINWQQPAAEIYNFIRGLSPYPAAWTEIADKNGNSLMLKIYKTEKIPESHSHNPGMLISDNKNYLKIASSDAYLNIKELQLQGKKRMSVKDLLNGFDVSGFGITE